MSSPFWSLGDDICSVGLDGSIGIFFKGLIVYCTSCGGDSVTFTIAEVTGTIEMLFGFCNFKILIYEFFLGF